MFVLNYVKRNLVCFKLFLLTFFNLSANNRSMKIDKEMARRLAEIRKIKGLTQEQFSEPLKIDRATISNLENGNVPLTEKNISLICLAFNINETWLRRGEGDIFVEEVPGWQELLDTFRKLSPSMRSTVKKIADLLLEEQAPAP